MGSNKNKTKINEYAKCKEIAERQETIKQKKKMHKNTKKIHKTEKTTV